MTPLDNAKRLEWEADVAVDTIRLEVQAAKAARDWTAYDDGLERLRLALENRLVRLAQRQVAELQTRNAKIAGRSS